MEFIIKDNAAAYKEEQKRRAKKAFEIHVKEKKGVTVKQFIIQSVANSFFNKSPEEIVSVSPSEISLEALVQEMLAETKVGKAYLQYFEDIFVEEWMRTAEFEEEVEELNE